MRSFDRSVDPVETRTVPNRPTRRSRGWIAAVAVLVLGLPAIAIAQDQALCGKLTTGRDVVIAAGEQVTGDLYAYAGTVRVDGSVEGDLVAGGGEVTVSGQVGGDLIAGAGTVHVTGTVDGDVRVGSGQVTIDGSIGEDLLVGSGRLTVNASGSIGEDVVFGTGETTLDGSVAGNVLGATGTYVRRGSIGGSEDVTVGGKEEAAAPTAGDRVLDAFQRLIAVLLVGALLLWIVPSTVERPATTMRRRPWASILVGLLGLVGIVAAFFAIVLALILLTLLFGLVGLADLVALSVFAAVVAVVLLVFMTYVILAFLAHLAVALAVGGLVLRDARGARRWAALVVGVLLVVVLTSIPVLGGWIGFLVVLLGLGAVLLAVWGLRRQPEPIAPTLPPPPTSDAIT